MNVDAPPPRHLATRRTFGLTLGWMLVAGGGGLALAGAVQAQNIELRSLDVTRQDGAVLLGFAVQPTLSKPVEEAMQRGIALYFEAQATVYRPRWYWRDERIARVTRTWRLAYQPLTSSWRVSQGNALQQTVATAAEALALVSRVTGWKLADAEQVEPGDKCYVEFSYRLDNTQLPKPMQLDLGSQAEWRLQVERTLKLD